MRVQKMLPRLLAIGVLLLVSTVNSQCPKCRNRDLAVLPTVDLIREFHLSESYEKYDVVPGSIPSQHAYRLHQDADLGIGAFQAFPIGIPFHFWFESTFRIIEDAAQPFYLFHVTDSQGVTQFSVSLDSSQQLITIGLPDNSGNVQTANFYHAKLFDHKWHKMLVSVLRDKVRVWVDCQQVVGIQNTFEEQLQQRRKFDVANGYAYIARYVDDTIQYLNTAQVDLQWMVLGCETTRPSKPNCDELPELQEVVKVPDSTITPVTTVPPLPVIPRYQECPIQCPQGPPGAPGTPGSDGRTVFGEQGERGERGLTGEPGQKGERGEPGVVVTRYEGDAQNFGEIQIREICGNLIKEQLDQLKPGMGAIGPPGPQGRPGYGLPGPKGDRGDDGYSGLQGERGEKGERGEDGRNGAPGVQGLPGMEGVSGSPGRPGDRGEDGRNGIPGSPGSPGQCPNDCYYTQMYMQQLQAAHALQQQSKGPSPLSLNVKG